MLPLLTNISWTSASDWVLAHQPVLIAVVVMNGFALIALVTGIAFNPSDRSKS